MDSIAIVAILAIGLRDPEILRHVNSHVEIARSTEKEAKVKQAKVPKEGRISVRSSDHIVRYIPPIVIHVVAEGTPRDMNALRTAYKHNLVQTMKAEIALWLASSPLRNRAELFASPYWPGARLLA
jgi:hypothetical protein